MGDSTVLVCDQTSTRPLCGQQRSQDSYGSILPYFNVDTELLRTLLHHCTEPRELEERSSVGSTEERSPTDPGYDSADASPVRSDRPALIESATRSVNGLVQQSFLSECDAQLWQLFGFVEFHLSKVEIELQALRQRMALQQGVDETARNGVTDSIDAIQESSSLEPERHPICAPNSSKEERQPLASNGSKEEEAQPLLQSNGSEEEAPLLQSSDSEEETQPPLTSEHSPISLLMVLREVVLSLLDSLNDSFANLDQLVKVHDNSPLASGSGTDFLLSKEERRRMLEARLEMSLSSIDEDRLRFLQHDIETNIDGQGRVRQENQVVIAMRNTPVRCTTWLAALLLVAVSAVVVYMYISDSPTWTVYLRLLRSPLLIVFYVYLIGINIKVWAAARVDYVGVFKFHARGVATARHLFKVAALFTMFFAAIVVVLLVVHQFHMEIPVKVLTLLMWLSLLVFLINPTKTFLLRGRLSFILMCVRVIIAPLHSVYFCDNWFADQLNSTVAVLLDLQYFVCYFSTGPWSGEVNKGICTSSGNGIRPIISCLPALWRMFQCLRLYRDERQVKHLVNAGKYATTYPVVIFATIFSVGVKTNFALTDLDFDDVGWIIVMWFLASLVHAIYTFLWDVHCDWGLVHCRPCDSLRSRLLYRPRLVYYLAMIFDFLLRFAWAVKLSLAIVWHSDSDWLYTLLVIGEMLRRFVWNFFRVENEHVCLFQDWQFLIT